MAITTYPLNNIMYSAEDAELFHVTRQSGVYAKNSFNYSITGNSNIITIGTGIGWIKNGEFAGKVIASKTATQLNLGVADATYPRIDAVVIQFNANTNSTILTVKNGIPASSPNPPSVIRTAAIYELHLYHVRRNAGEASISAGNITDLRLNNAYCGLMGDSITEIDTSAIAAQIEALVKYYKDKIANIESSNAFLLRDGSSSMQGNLNMNGYGIENIKEPTAATDIVTKGYADEHYEVMGLVHGHYSVSTATDLDNVLTDALNSIETHKFINISVYSSNTTAGLPRADTWGVTLFKKTESSGYLVARTTNSTNGVYEMKRVYKNNVWQPWEHVNPLLSVGVEYRTSERYGVNPVYQKIINFGTLAEGLKSVNHGVSGMHRIIDAQIVGSDRPILLTNNSIVTSFFVDDTGVHIVGGTAANIHEAQVWIKYNKDE